MEELAKHFCLVSKTVANPRTSRALLSKINHCRELGLAPVRSTEELSGVIELDPHVAHDELAARCCMRKEELMQHVQKHWLVAMGPDGKPAVNKDGQGLILPKQLQAVFDSARLSLATAQRFKEALAYGWRMLYLTAYFSRWGTVYLAAYCRSGAPELSLDGGEIDLCIPLLQCSFCEQELLLDLNAGIRENLELQPRIAVYRRECWDIDQQVFVLQENIKPFFLEGYEVMNYELGLVCRTAELEAETPEQMLELIAARADRQVVGEAIAELHGRQRALISSLGMRDTE